MGFVVCGLLRRFTPRNDEGTKGSIHKLVIARVHRTRGNLGMGHNHWFIEFFCFFVFAFLLIVNSFIFLFFGRGFVVCGLLRFARNDSAPHMIIARTEGSWQSRYSKHYIILIIEFTSTTHPTLQFCRSHLYKVGQPHIVITKAKGLCQSRYWTTVAVKQLSSLQALLCN